MQKRKKKGKKKALVNAAHVTNMSFLALGDIKHEYLCGWCALDKVQNSKFISHLVFITINTFLDELQIYGYEADTPCQIWGILVVL